MSLNVFVSVCISVLLLCLSHTATAQSTSAASRTNDGIDEQLKIILNFYNPDSSLTIADAANTRYNNNYSRTVTSEDAGKPTNVDENVAIFRDNHKLMVERRPLVDSYDTTFLLIYSMKLRSYRFDIIPIHITAPLLSAYIYDSYTQLKTPISLLDTTRLSFIVTNDTGTYKSNRFIIYFRPAIHFRSSNSGNWNDRAIWQASSDSTNWQAADVSPLGTVRSLTVRAPHAISVSETTGVQGKVNVLSGAKVTTIAGKGFFIKK